jgi:hypothetical protein
VAKRRPDPTCSPKCSADRRRAPNINCDCCGKSFHPKDRHKRYCSKLCASRHKGKDRTGTPPDPIPGAAWIPLGDGVFALVDADQFDALNRFVWSFHPPYAVRHEGGRANFTRVHMHRHVLGLEPGDDSSWGDHKNRNQLDNRMENLRRATPTQNVANCGLRKTNKSGFKGVHFCNRAKRWVASIGEGRRRFFLGYFDTPEDAAAKYDERARARHGSFGRYNFPRDGEASARPESSSTPAS